MNRAVFLDRDGVINKLLPDNGYVLKWEDFEFLPGAKEAVARLLDETDYYIIVISNQSGIGRGFVDAVTVSNIFHRMKAALLGIEMSEWFDKKNDSVFASSPLFFYFCPHAPYEGLDQLHWSCACRKPSPGMIYKAATEHEIDLSKSWMVGDSWADIKAGRRAEILNVIKIGEKEPFGEFGFAVVKYFGSLLQAVEYILGQEAENEG